MPTDVTNKTGNVEIRLAAYHDCDDVQLCWRAKVGDQLDAAIPNCLGFMIERQRQDGTGAWGATEILRNRVDQFGVSEPVIQQQGADRILVEYHDLQEG